MSICIQEKSVTTVNAEDDDDKDGNDSNDNVDINDSNHYHLSVHLFLRAQ